MDTQAVHLPQNASGTLYAITHNSALTRTCKSLYLRSSTKPLMKTAAHVSSKSVTAYLKTAKEAPRQLRRDAAERHALVAPDSTDQRPATPTPAAVNASYQSARHPASRPSNKRARNCLHEEAAKVPSIQYKAAANYNAAANRIRKDTSVRQALAALDSNRKDRQYQPPAARASPLTSRSIMHADAAKKASTRQVPAVLDSAWQRPATPTPGTRKHKQLPHGIPQAAHHTRARHRPHESHQHIRIPTRPTIMLRDGLPDRHLAIAASRSR